MGCTAALHRLVTTDVGPDRVALVTDAMAAAGMQDGSYRLGSLAVDVVDQIARVAGTDTIAGSTATMQRLVAQTVNHGGADRAESCGPPSVRSPSTRCAPSASGAGALPAPRPTSSCSHPIWTSCR